VRGVALKHAQAPGAQGLWAAEMQQQPREAGVIWTCVYCGGVVFSRMAAHTQGGACAATGDSPARPVAMADLQAPQQVLM
jgi:hypothetical protein